MFSQLPDDVGNLVGDEPGIGVAQDAQHVLQAIPALCSRHLAGGLQRDEQVKQRGEGCLREGVARCDVGLPDLGGQTMDDGLQQTLVAKHDGGLATIFHPAFLAQPAADIACLYIVGRCADVGDVLGLVEVVVDGVGVVVELVGEEL